MALGWARDQIRIIDADQGKSGSGKVDRSGFRDLLARTGAGEVGIILSLEISRLGRAHAELQRLYHMAALTNTLIMDEAGVHDPKDGSDRLLLGIKSSVYEFELSCIRERMLGGKINKAARGELRLVLPVGLVYDPADVVVLDPDIQVVEAITHVFEAFRRTGSAKAAHTWLIANEIMLPSRPMQKQRQLVWSAARYSRVITILKNPRYAGCYVWRPRKQAGHNFVHTQDAWEVCLPESHVGYISWEEYLANQRQLKANSISWSESDIRRSAPRKGASLLQSRVICGLCGRLMKTRYNPTSDRWKRKAHRLYLCELDHFEYGKKKCQRMRGEKIDKAVSDFIIGAVNQRNLAVTLAVHEQMLADFAKADRQRCQQIERLEHVADKARERYYFVDPGNRLVAATLEKEWNDAMRIVEKAEQERDKLAKAFECLKTEEQKRRIEELAKDFAEVWSSPAQDNVDRKRMLALLVEDVTLTRTGQLVAIQLRMRGGKTVELEPVALAGPGNLGWKTPPETVAEIERLSEVMDDNEIAATLNQSGFTGSMGKPLIRAAVTSIRHNRGIPGLMERRIQALREQGWYTPQELSEKVGISARTLLERSRRGVSYERNLITISTRQFSMIRKKKNRSNLKYKSPIDHNRYPN